MASSASIATALGSSLESWLEGLPFSPAVVGVTLLLIAATYVLFDRSQKRAITRRWEDVCQRVINNRNELRHRVIEEADLPAVSPAPQNSNCTPSSSCTAKNTTDRATPTISAREIEDTRIAKMKGTELTESMRSGEISAERVVSAFARRARVVGNMKTRSVTQEFYDEAVELAAKVDAARRKGDEGGGRKGDGALLGIPISIKDTFHMKGAVSSIFALVIVFLCPRFIPLVLCLSP